MMKCQLNKMKANSQILSILQFILIIGVYFAMRDNVLIVDLLKIVPFALGFIKLLFFGLFFYYEKAGAY